MSKELYRLPSGDRNTAVGIFFSAVGAVFSVILGSIWIATQYTAWKLGYAPELGSALVSFPGSPRLYLKAVALIVGGIAIAMLAGRRIRSHVTPVALLALLFGL